MGLWDDLKGMLTKSSEEASKKAASTAAKAAAAKALDAVEAVGDDFLDFAEGELKDAQSTREGRKDVRPSGDSAADIAARIEASARAAEDAADAAHARPTRAPGPRDESEEEAPGSTEASKDVDVAPKDVETAPKDVETAPSPPPQPRESAWERQKREKAERVSRAESELARLKAELIVARMGEDK